MLELDKHKYKKVPSLKKTNATLKRQYQDRALWDAFSEFIRLRGAVMVGGEPYNTCFTCGATKPVYGGLLHAGHFIKRQALILKYDETNVQPQCKKCNSYQGGRQLDFAFRLDEAYGEGYWKKLYLKGSIRRRAVDALQAKNLAARYKTLVKGQKKALGISESA